MHNLLVNQIVAPSLHPKGLRHVSHMASKVLPMLQKAASSFYDSNKDKLHDLGRTAAQQGLDYATQQASNAGHKTLASVMQMGRQSL